jgi:hypothetical protein
MGFKAKKLSKGLFEVVGLETFIEQKIAAWAKKLGFTAAPAAKKVTLRKTAKTAKAAKPATAKVATTVDQLVAKLDVHPKKAALIRSGKQKDQLLRSLVPLYLAQKLPNLEITSGDTSEFWKLHGVKYLAPNAAKALREHVGYARRTKSGPQITPNGIKYVEAALKGTPLKRAA